jgi:hypothetical protein
VTHSLDANAHTSEIESMHQIIQSTLEVSDGTRAAQAAYVSEIRKQLCRPPVRDARDDRKSAKKSTRKSSPSRKRRQA